MSAALCPVQDRTTRWNTPRTAEQWMGKLGDWFIPEPNTGCWLWARFTRPNGYGYLGTRPAYRVSYEFLRGPIPAGLTIDHLCRQPSCVNPDHLEPVTMRENILRGQGAAAINARMTHCKNGHPLSGDNLCLEGPQHRVRRCRTCKLEHQRIRDRANYDPIKRHAKYLRKLAKRRAS